MELSSETMNLIRRYQAGGELLESCIQRVPEALLDVAPAPGKWTARQITVHVCDTEFVMGHRIRLAIAEPGSMVSSFDQDIWVDKLGSGRISVSTTLKAFRAMRDFTSEILCNTPPGVWANTVKHNVRGDITLRWYVEHAAEHAEKHVDQIRRIVG